jgi:phenolic acid decarboxylase
MTSNPTKDATIAQFNQDLKDLHLVYDYDAENPESGKPEKWRYEIWFFSPHRVVYAIHGGPMAGRKNYQTATYQCIRPGELWQCNWLEETGTIVSLVYDMKMNKITTLLAFSNGHWGYPEQARGDKRNKDDFERWRGLAKQGDKQTDRFLLSEQADILKTFHGQGELEPIEESWPTL